MPLLRMTRASKKATLNSIEKPDKKEPMKLSLAWIFDHIDADWQQQSAEKIVELFNKTTAEVESFYHIAHDLTQFFMVKPETSSSPAHPEERADASVSKGPPLTPLSITIPELKQTITLPTRSALFTEPTVSWLIKKDGSMLMLNNFMNIS